MPVKIACPNPNCGESYIVAEEDLGRLTRCEKCQAEFSLVPRTRLGASSDTEVDSYSTLQAAIEEDLPSPFGRYQIVRILGRGGMGAVYLAHDSQLDRMVALKVPHRKFAQDNETRERFLREARTAARFDHPNFCPIHDTGEIDSLPYLTMPYIEGAPLAARIEKGRPWDQREAAEIVRRLAIALAEAHLRGIVHRDLKPANVMIDARGGLVIMDFGLARRFEGGEEALTAAGAVIGTPVYMSPEQAEGLSGEIGPHSDVYSLGVILYELLSGRRPFEGSTARILAMVLTTEPPAPSMHHPMVSPTLEAVCLKAMAKVIRDRHASMGELAGALQAWLDAIPSPEDRPEAAPPLLGGASDLPAGVAARRRLLKGSRVIIGGAALLLGVALAYWATERGQIKILVDDPAAIVRVDGKEIGAEALGGTIALRVGEHEVSLRRGDGKVETRKVLVRRGGAETLSFSPSPEPGPTPGPDADPLTNSLGMTLKLIPAGEFWMGTDTDDPQAKRDELVDGRRHPVRIAEPFYIGTTEVTVGQFRRFVEDSHYDTEAERPGQVGIGWDATKADQSISPEYTWRSPGFPQTEDDPVVTLGWADAVAFCEWLAKREGQSYRLPTEAEWEYCCRAGTTTRYWSGDDVASMMTIANICDESIREKWPTHPPALEAKDGYAFTSPVGRFRPNAFGLFDMHGNVWEWCADWYDSHYYSDSPPANPTGPESSPIGRRVARGGSWLCLPIARSAQRNHFEPGLHIMDIGFRVVRDRSSRRSFADRAADRD